MVSRDDPAFLVQTIIQARSSIRRLHQHHLWSITRQMLRDFP
jgi:hypothetical protein